MSATYFKIKNPVFRHVCEQILRRECVPFLGSGISIDCQYSGMNADFKDNKRHTVRGMKLKLSSEDKDLDEKCERFLWKSKIDLNESFKKLTETLQVTEFINLDPTLGHFCIALLVREGLLSQIITTNYDCALERAFLRSYGQKCVLSDGSNRDRSCEKYVSIIYDQVSCVHQRSGSQGSGECLHLYKINGCACALKRKVAKYPEIQLTITQLQSWRDRRWAEDTFRVVLRSKTVLFSGFGSDEPQVIHTVHQILDEYKAFASNKEIEIDIKKPPLPPNTPVVHCFEPEPEFCQLQITNNFVQSYCGKYNQDLAENFILTKGSLLGGASAKDKLPANEFWLMIYQEVQNLQVINILSSASAGQLAVSAFPMSKYLFESIKRDWEADNSILRNFFLSKTDIEHLPTNLAKLLSYLINGDNRYAPLQLYQNPTCECLLICWAFKPDFGRLTLYKDKQNTQWLRIISKKGNEILYVTGKRPLRGEIQNISKGDAVGLSAAFLLTTECSLNRPIEKTLRLVFHASGIKSYQMISLFNFQELMILAEQNIKTGGLERYKEFFSDVIRYPRKWRGRLDTKKKEKYSKEAQI